MTAENNREVTARSSAGNRNAIDGAFKPDFKSFDIVNGLTICKIRDASFKNVKLWLRTIFPLFHIGEVNAHLLHELFR